MTWAELIQMASQHAPNADVWVSIHPPHMLCRTNYPLSGIRSGGDMVFLDGANEHVEGGGNA